MWQKDGSVGNTSDLPTNRGTRQAVCTHHGDNDVSMESADGLFGSGFTQVEQPIEPGDASALSMVMPVEGRTFPAFPSFCGGAGSHDDAMGENAPEDEMFSQDALQHMEQMPLDYVLQSLQCRLGNPRNRCFANAPFRLWACAGSFLAGTTMWNQTASAVLAALRDEDVVQITKLQTLKPMWSKFDENIQNDAAQFLLEMVEMAKADNVITHHHHHHHHHHRHVDHRQQVHRRKEFPTHLIFEDRGAPQQFEELINQWANQAEGQVLDGLGLPKSAAAP